MIRGERAPAWGSRMGLLGVIQLRGAGGYRDS